MAWSSLRKLLKRQKGWTSPDERWLLEGLDDGQEDRFARLIEMRLCRKLGANSAIDEAWWNLGRQIYVDVAARGGEKRLDTYSRLYNFYQAFQVAILIIAFVVVAKASLSNHYLILLLLIPLSVAAWACIWQTNEYNGYYTRELIQQFLILPLLTPEETFTTKAEAPS